MVPYIEPSLKTPSAQMSFESKYEESKMGTVFLLSEEQGCGQNQFKIPRISSLNFDGPDNSVRIPANENFRMLIFTYAMGQYASSYSCETIYQFKPKQDAKYRLVSTLQKKRIYCGVKVYEKLDGVEKLITPDKYLGCS